MKVSTEEEVIIKDFDDLKEALGDIPLVKEISRLYFLGKKPRKVFKAYIKNRKGLIKLLKKDKWELEDTIEAIKRGIKICAGRDYLDAFLESKEKELENYMSYILNSYPQLIELSREYLVKTQRKLMKPSYLSRFVDRISGKEDDTLLNEISALRCVLFHPMQRYISHAYAFNFAENLAANKRVKIMNECRKNVLRILKRMTPKEFYKKVTSAYNELNSLIRFVDKQEELEKGKMGDLVLIDSLLKNLCPHNPPHYKGAKTPKEFLYKLMECPNVKEFIAIASGNYIKKIV